MAPGQCIWFALNVAACAAGSAWFVRRYALRRGLLDHPDERRSHHVPTPRGGGVGIVGVWLLVLALSCASRPEHMPSLLAIIAGMSLVAGIGWIDDHRALSPWSRLAVHAIAALLLGWAIWRAGGSTTDSVLAFAAALVLVNVWNFMDGIDGLAASQAAIAAAAYALMSDDPATIIMACALAAACCGFLPLNFPRARIFLGDVGSGALGYALAVLFVFVAIERGSGFSAWLALLIPLSAFLIDASLTLCRRMLRGDRWWTAHVEHAYQQLAFRAGAHWPVTLAYAAWTCCGVLILALASRAMVMDGGTAINIVIAVGWGLTGALAWAWIARTPPQNQLGRRR
jgi:UDP-N-acetylmuramyl pentapeptide phosphotransferase/UDP-N-acetylglucosamine-1-phosphate transferase